MESVVLKVVLILGIIIAGGFLLFFMADIIMAIFNGKKDEKVIKANEKEEVSKVKKELEGTEMEDVAEAVVNGAVVENYNPNEENEEPAEEEIEAEDAEEAEEAEEEIDEEAEEEEDEDDELVARRKALMERLARMNEEYSDEEEGAVEDEEEESEEAEEEIEEEEADEEEEVVDLDEEETEEEAEEEEETEEAEEEDDNVSEELEEARRALEEERAKTMALQAELAEARRQSQTAEPVYLSEEEYEARLAVLNERLKLNEKELRACKKEFIPLRRVKKSLESDEKKLRRKEALVAKQKVVLYGVNNYEDIDEEKAKKLAEDLDHLDGLKLSVEHCEEVMAKNAERYPLLERIYTVLSENNETIKADIARAEKELAEVRAKKGSTDEE